MASASSDAAAMFPPGGFWVPAPQPQQMPPDPATYQQQTQQRALGAGVNVTTGSIPLYKLPRVRLSEAAAFLKEEDGE